MSCDDGVDEAYISSESDMPSTEGELPDEYVENNKEFIVTVERLNEYGIIPSQPMRSKETECFIYNPIDIHIRPHEQIMISLGISIRVMNSNYSYYLKQHQTLKNNDIILIAYIYDTITSELKVIVKNVNSMFEKRILRGEKIARVVFRKRIIKEIKFIIH